MTRPAYSTTIRAALIAIATFGAASLTATGAAEARHFRGLGLSINLSDGYSSIRLGPSCRSYYRKAVATGDAYWWDRYYDCRAYR